MTRAENDWFTALVWAALLGPTVAAPWAIGWLWIMGVL
jgi:hypothetical protein